MIAYPRPNRLIGGSLAQVSVIIPTLDRTLLLARSLTTVLAQRRVDVEVVVVDDGSTPALTSVPGLGHLLSDPRVRVVRHPETRGVAAARNTGISEASAPWLAFLDDDDVWARDKLAAQLDALADRPGCSWSYTGEVTLDGDLTVLRVTSGPPSDAMDLRLLQLNAVPGGGSSVLAAAAIVQEAGGFDESFSILADWDLWIRLALLGRPAPVADALVGYFKHKRGLSFDTRRSLEEFGRLEEKYRSLRRARNVEIGSAGYLRYIADIECRAGRRWSAANHRLRAALPRPGPRSLALSAATLASPAAVYRMLDRRSMDACAVETVDAARRWLKEMSEPAPAGGRPALGSR